MYILFTYVQVKCHVKHNSDVTTLMICKTRNRHYEICLEFLVIIVIMDLCSCQDSSLIVLMGGGCKE